MASFKLFSLLTIIYFLCISCESAEASQNSSKEASGYVTVREDAHMFWWLLYANTSDNHNHHLNDYHSYPLIIWLQGGPGASSTGFGNFQEIGPLDTNLKERNTSWISYANLLFIDNPVGTGYSYVSNSSAYAKTNKQIAKDLVVLLKNFLQKLPDFKTIPLYIFCESYGGKMTTGFAVELYQSIQNHEIQCNFQGIALGDSWISPIDSVATWGPYLYSLSFIDANERQKLNASAQQIREALNNGKYEEATNLWSSMEGQVESLTDGVNFYNVLQSNSEERKKSQLYLNAVTTLDYTSFESSFRERAIHRLAPLHQDDLYTLMNGVIKTKLNIPSSVIWGGQSAQVFANLQRDFMLPVVDQIDYLLNSTDIQVVVYTGQLDLIVDTIGTLNWINSLKWQEIKKFQTSPKKVITDEFREAAAFYKSYKNFSFFWILKAGHMVPSDAGTTATKMVQKIISKQKVQ